MKEKKTKNKNKNKKEKQNYLQQLESDVTWKESVGRADLPNLHCALED